MGKPIEIDEANKPRNRGGRPPASRLAIAWILNKRVVTGVIGGPRTLAQWSDYVAGLPVQLTEADEAFVEGLMSAGHASTHGYTDPMYAVIGRRTAK